MKIKHCLFVGFLSVITSLHSYSQQCGHCKQTSSVANYDLDVQVPKPDLNNVKDNEWLEWLQLFWVSKHANATLFQNNKNCIRFTQPIDANLSNESLITKEGIEVPPLLEESEMLKVGETYTNLPPPGDLSRFGNYISTGYVKKTNDGYVMHVEIQTACSRKTVASASVPFQLSAYSQNSVNIGQQAATQLSPLIEKIKHFELKKRQEDNKVALESGTGDDIIIKPQKRNLAIGEQTDLEITMTDCDGAPLGNRKIVFTKASLNGIPISSGTTGGTVTPSSVITDAAGKAKAIFKMSSGKSAIIDAHHIYEKPYGCEDVKLGSTPIGSIPVKVEVNYIQNEIRWVNRATLPGVKIKGGAESEQHIVFHTSISYHYPDAAMLKKGFLVNAGKEDAADGSSVFLLESGYYDYTKKVEDAYIMGMVADKPVVADIEKGSQSKIEGYASVQHPSEIMFFLGDNYEPAAFMWNVQYPASDDGIGGGGATIVKGEESVQWVVNKINDTNNPYKTEYLLSLSLNAAEEFKKGNKAMKDLFGTDLDGLTRILDPTNPQSNMAGASGSQTITVRILSPYPEK